MTLSCNQHADCYVFIQSTCNIHSKWPACPAKQVLLFCLEDKRKLDPSAEAGGICPKRTKQCVKNWGAYNDGPPRAYQLRGGNISASFFPLYAAIILLHYLVLSQNVGKTELLRAEWVCSQFVVCLYLVENDNDMGRLLNYRSNDACRPFLHDPTVQLAILSTVHPTWPGGPIVDGPMKNHLNDQQYYVDEKLCDSWECAAETWVVYTLREIRSAVSRSKNVIPFRLEPPHQKILFGVLCNA